MYIEGYWPGDGVSKRKPNQNSRCVIPTYNSNNPKFQ